MIQIFCLQLPPFKQLLLPPLNQLSLPPLNQPTTSASTQPTTSSTPPQLPLPPLNQLSLPPLNQKPGRSKREETSSKRKELLRGKLDRNQKKWMIKANAMRRHAVCITAMGYEKRRYKRRP